MAFLLIRQLTMLKDLICHGNTIAELCRIAGVMLPADEIYRQEYHHP